MNIAFAHYRSKHGTDTLIIRTDADSIDKLPALTPQFLENVFGMVEPDLENDEVEWIAVYPIDALPTVIGGKSHA